MDMYRRAYVHTHPKRKNSVTIQTSELNRENFLVDLVDIFHRRKKLFPPKFSGKIKEWTF